MVVILAYLVVSTDLAYCERPASFMMTRQSNLYLDDLKRKAMSCV